MTPSQAESQLFDDTLSCSLVLPCHLHPLSDSSDAGAEMRLHAIALVEDGRVEDSEERQEKGIAFQRLEAKIDLIMALCGRLLSRYETHLTNRSLKLSAHGLQIQLPAGHPVPDTSSRWAISMQAADWLPDPVTIPVILLARQSDQHGDLQLWLQFDLNGAGLQQALERHVFRLHRRHVALQRQTR